MGKKIVKFLLKSLDYLPYFILILSVLIFLADGYLRGFKGNETFRAEGNFALGYILGFMINSVR